MSERIERVMRILLAEFRNKRKPAVRRTSEKGAPFKTLVACLLSLRTQDENTEKASASLFAVADTPEQIARMPVRKLERLIYSSGYYRNKARSIKHVCTVLLRDYGGRVPDTREELMAIKGIGPKTANIVLCFAYGRCVIPVDTHVHRIPNRLGLVKTKKPEETEAELMRVLQRKYWRAVNSTFILFGKSVCLPVSPKCSICPVKGLCPRIGVARSR